MNCFDCKYFIEDQDIEMKLYPTGSTEVTTLTWECCKTGLYIDDAHSYNEEYLVSVMEEQCPINILEEIEKI